MQDNMKIGVKVVLDSINTKKDRITTMVCRMPRFILAEFLTHRLFSRNSASSRAIPSRIMLKKVKETPFVPIAWQKTHKGMQGKEYIEGTKERIVVTIWKLVSRVAVFTANLLEKIGVTKQLTNRLLEPFLFHDVLVTFTDFSNFEKQRFHKDAEIHIYELARCMKIALELSKPTLLQQGEWHLPFTTDLDNSYTLLDKIKISTSRCARSSYGNFEGNTDARKDVKLHNDLVMSEPKHLSPTEHQGQAMGDNNYDKYGVLNDDIMTYGICKNFKGFIQYRDYVEKGNINKI